MHDWTLLTINFDWKSGQARLDFLNQYSILVSIFANDVSNICVPRRNDWGPSVSVSNTISITPVNSVESQIKIEMQSGDIIEINAKSFIFSDVVSKLDQ